MPYTSQAQRAKFHELLKQGKISQATVDEFDKASKGKILPKYAVGSTASKPPTIFNKEIKARRNYYGQ